FMADPKAYSGEDWERYVAQARAIIESAELDQAIAAQRRLTSWGWLRQMLGLRLTGDFGRMLTQSAREHEIALTAGFHPFEAALTKYYAVPAFSDSGDFLWNFLPQASPAVNYHPDRVGFAHYRTILSEMGNARGGQLGTIEICDPQNVSAFLERFKRDRDNFEIVAAPFPPLQHDSWVLVRNPAGEFRLQRYGVIAQAVESRLTRLAGCQFLAGDDALRISGIEVPEGCRYLLLSNPSGIAGLDVPSDRPVVLRSLSGNRLGRENVYWVNSPDGPAAKETRVAGIPADAEYYTDFQATEASIDHFRQ